MLTKNLDFSVARHQDIVLAGIEIGNLVGRLLYGVIRVIRGRCGVILLTCYRLIKSRICCLWNNPRFHATSSRIAGNSRAKQSEFRPVTRQKLWIWIKACISSPSEDYLQCIFHEWLLLLPVLSSQNLCLQHGIQMNIWNVKTHWFVLSMVSAGIGGMG